MSQNMASSSEQQEPEPNEITALLPPDTPARRASRTPSYYNGMPKSPVPSNGRRDPPPRPIPLRKSPYSSWGIRLCFIGLVLLAFISAFSYVLLSFNIYYPRSIAQFLPMHRSSRMLPAWYAALATWLSLSTLVLFWTPSVATRWSLVTSVAFAGVDLILLVLVPTLFHQENLLTFFACLLTLLVTLLCLVSNRLVADAKDEMDHTIESRARNLREAERRAELLMLAEENNYWAGQLYRIFKLVTSFLMVFLTSILLGFMTFDLLIRAYDSTYPLPFKNSRIITVNPPQSANRYRVHIMCTGPNAARPPRNDTNLLEQDDDDTMVVFKKVPTILYEAPGYTTGTEASEWLLDMRERQEVGRVCIWDRPGYGFSDASSNAEMGHIADALWEALQKNEEKGPFVLVAEGYGGLLLRIFSAKHSDLIDGHIWIDAETSHTYFLRPHHRAPFFHSQLPAILAPLTLHRFLSFPHHDINSTTDNGASRLNRILSPNLNPLTLSTIFQEHQLSHSASSPSFTTLLRTLRDYPSDASTIVLSNAKRMQVDNRWQIGQKTLWEEVTSEKGRLRWDQVDGGSGQRGERICTGWKAGREACREAVLEMLWN